MKNKVAIYIRVSTNHQIDKDSLPMQRNDLVAYASIMLNTDDYVIFEDAGYSGKNTDRPAFQEMMSRIRNGEFTHMLVWKIDRISRNLLDFATMYNELKRLGVAFVSKNEQFDTSTAMGEAMLKIILVFAELERNMTSERVTATMISRASSGQWNGGRVPYGYDYDAKTKTFTINEAEKEVVILIHDIYNKKHSINTVTNELNRLGIKTRAGNNWSVPSIHIILKSIFYTGSYLYNKHKDGDRYQIKPESEWIIIENHHPQIISKEQKDNIIKMLKQNQKIDAANSNYVSPTNIHIFGGIVYCEQCGARMTSCPGNIKRFKRVYSRYSCPNRRNFTCDAKHTNDDNIGEILFNYILNMLNIQSNFSPDMSIANLEKKLLKGNSFNYIESIEPAGLEEMRTILMTGTKDNIYIAPTIQTSKAEQDLSDLKITESKIKRAIARLTNLYLYSNDAMSEKDFIIEKSNLESRLEYISAKIKDLEENKQVIDTDFVAKASSLILSKKLTDRNYINYRRLSDTIDHTVLKSFVASIVNRIYLQDGLIKQIEFKNGMVHCFIPKTDNN